jgi:hypothetical protein
MGVGGQRHTLAALPPGNDPVPIVQEAGWAPGPVWTNSLAGAVISCTDEMHVKLQ